MAQPRIQRDARIFQRDDFTCQYCGYKGDTFEKWRYLVVDHFKPRARAGMESDDNLKTSCMDCNIVKRSLEFATIEDAREAFQPWIRKEREDYEKFFRRGSS